MLKINLGCGGNILPGWDNHDMDVDVEKPLPWNDNQVDYINLEHCLEHVSGRSGYLFMEQALRVLRPGGRLRISVPVLARLDRAHARDIIIGHGHMMVYNLQNMIDMLLIAGFDVVREVKFDPSIDGHWKQIGEDKDSKETMRVEAIKK